MLNEIYESKPIKEIIFPINKWQLVINFHS